MATFFKFEAFVEHLAEKVHNLGADTLKVMLTNTAPVATNSVKADLTEITAANGYPAGGNPLTVSSSGQTGGLYKLVVADSVFTAVGGPIGPFRYAVVYNDTPASPADPLICSHDYGSSINLFAGETFTWDANPTNGLLQLS
jgi:hypothetical protein